ncbi:phosphomannomutase/phosphoglucomutase, partial [Lysobacter lacus]
MSNAHVDRLKPLVPLGAALALLLAGWFGFNAWSQWRDEARHDAVQASRDAVVQAVRSSLGVAQKRFSEQLASPGVRDALSRGLMDRAAEQLTAGWPGATGGEVRPAELGGAYDELATPGAKKLAYGHVAALESAIAEGKPVAWAIREGGKGWIALAAPVTAGTTPAVAFVRLPIEKISGALQSAAVDGDTYLALRQGNATLAEKGDTQLAGSAEALAAKVEGSDLRVAAAVPDVAGGPLGLGSTGCAIASLLFLL